jgi:hypothetical protein
MSRSTRSVFPSSAMSRERNLSRFRSEPNLASARDVELTPMDGLRLGLMACFKESYKRPEHKSTTRFRTEAYAPPAEEGDVFAQRRSTRTACRSKCCYHGARHWVSVRGLWPLPIASIHHLGGLRALGANNKTLPIQST